MRWHSSTISSEKLAPKLVEVAGDRLHAAKDHFTVALFTLEARGENIRFQAERAILGVVLRHQLFNVRQHQHATARQARKFGDNQAFTSPVGSTIAAGS